MGTIDLAALINEAAALGLSFNTKEGGLKVTGPKTPEAAALVQRLAPHKAAVIELLQTPLQPVPTFALEFEQEPAAPVIDAEPVVMAALPPVRNTTGKPSLPVDLWVNGLATFAEAHRRQFALGEYGTALGMDATGFFIRCPGWQWANADSISSAHLEVDHVER